MKNARSKAEILYELKRIFGNDNVKKEWDVAKNSRDAYTRELYCPRVDFAVGPFNIDANIAYNNRLINELYYKHEEILERLKSRSDSNDRALETNENPRCFLALELEARTSRKHRLGSLINASAIGKIGIIVAVDDSVFESLVKIRRYLEFLQRVWKTRNAPKNVIIITEDNFLKTLKEPSR